ncbi:MAG: serine hydrolase [Gemmatimonadota bacterium]|jgi:D-alanyl-D-alanine carboxypeptidase
MGGRKVSESGRAEARPRGPGPGTAVTRTVATQVALVLAAALCIAGCTMDIATPVVPPPDPWDPALNTHPDSAAFQALLDRYAGEGLPGVVLLVRTPEGVWNGAAGFAQAEAGVPMQPAHRHYAGSVTKMYTAATVLLLAGEGQIQLDAPIRQYLPERVYGRVPNGREATVRQLLGHTSGIPDFDGSLAYEIDNLNDPLGDYQPERLLGYLEGQAPFSAPGAHYWYSNANYFLLALILEEVTGLPHAQVIHDRVLAQLGLDATYYREAAGVTSVPGLVNSYEDVAGDAHLMNVSDLARHGAQIAYGQSGIMATSADYADFLEALLGGQLLDPAMLAEMESHTRCDCYGLGLSFRDTEYGKAIGHDGSDVGARSEVRRFPGLDATLVLLVNGAGGAVDDLFDQLWDDAMAAALAGS